MATDKHTLTCRQANEIDLVDYLSTLGYFPVKTKGSDYWFISPFRNEETASFKVHRSKNVWFDHGAGKGGSLIDFGLHYFNCQIPELLSRLSEISPFHQPLPAFPKPVQMAPDNPVTILNAQPINSLDLLLYLKDRRIDFSIATRYCRQVHFSIQNKEWKALGFKNDQGGYELRSKSFKGSSSPKASTTFLQEADDLIVFEGFFDFMSFQMMHQNQEMIPSDFLILNSTAFFEQNRPFMESYSSVQLFLDQDPSGKKCTQQALSWSAKFQDKSSLYSRHKDLNEWIQSIGKAQVNSFRPRLK